MPLVLTELLSGCGGEKEKNSEEAFEESADTGQTPTEDDETTSDIFDDQSGPFYHDVYKTRSQDGLYFETPSELILEHASVPDILRFPDRRLFIYAVDGTNQSESNLLVAISEDDGETWQRNTLQLTSAYRNSATGADPEAILLLDERVRLYYIVHSEESQQNSVNNVLSATSTDGVHFEEEAGFRFSYDDITDPDVVKIDTTWFMYLAQGKRLIATTSNNGLFFSLEDTVREKGSVSNTVPINETQWRQYFCVNNAIKSAVTSDGRAWVDDTDFRISPEQGKIFCDPAPVKVNNEWLFVYKVAPTGT